LATDSGSEEADAYGFLEAAFCCLLLPVAVSDFPPSFSTVLAGADYFSIFLASTTTTFSVELLFSSSILAAFSSYLLDPDLIA